MSWAFANITCEYFNILSKPDQEAEIIHAINGDYLCHEQFERQQELCELDGIRA